MLEGVDAMTVMWYNEYDQIINAGYNPDELSTFFFHVTDVTYPKMDSMFKKHL
jgi:NitT/TauT family transport system substrate-binding protein